MVTRIRGTIADVPELFSPPRFFDWIVVSEHTGKILAIGSSNDGDEFGDPASVSREIRLEDDEILIPGLVDTHIHASQYPFHGTGLSEPLMAEDVGFLHGHAFPTERKLRDKKEAARTYAAVVHDTLRNGTTTALYYGTIHRESTLELARECKKRGQRAFVGMVQLDRMMPEEDMREAWGAELSDGDTRSVTDLCVAATELFLGDPVFMEGNALGTTTVQPILTPRFLPSCSKSLLEKLTAVVRRIEFSHVLIQTHMQESLDEVEFAKSVWSTFDRAETPYTSDLKAFEECGLLLPRVSENGCDVIKNMRMVSAHSVWMRSEEEMELLRRYKVGVAHCPLSNFYFADGAFDVVRMHKFCEIGLGTDVAGGYSPSILVNMRHAVTTAKAIRNGAAGLRGVTCDSPDEKEKGFQPHFTIFDALYLATVGGARVCALESRIGKFEVGMEFDAITLRKEDLPERVNSSADRNVNRKIMLERLLHLCDDRHVKRIWVQGKPIDLVSL